MARDLDVGVPLLGQVVAAMLLVSAAIGLVAGPLADRYGHRRVILLGSGFGRDLSTRFWPGSDLPCAPRRRPGGRPGQCGGAGSLAGRGRYLLHGRRGSPGAGVGDRMHGGLGDRRRAGPDRRRHPHRLAAGVHRRRCRGDRSRLVGAAWLPRDARAPDGRLRSETLWRHTGRFAPPSRPCAFTASPYCAPSAGSDY